MNPEAQTAEMIGPELVGGRKFLASGVLAPNSYFYFAPFCDSQVLCVKPEGQIAEMIGPELDGERKFLASGVLAPTATSTSRCTARARSCA